MRQLGLWELWNSIALTSIIVTELANAMKYEEGVLDNFVFTEFPFKMVSGDVTAFHTSHEREVLRGL